VALVAGASIETARASVAPALREAAANRDLVRTSLAYGSSCIVEWTLWVGVLVYAYELGGETAAGFASLTLLLPAAVVALYGAALADGPRPNRVLFTVYAAQFVALASAAALAHTGAAPLLVTLPAAAAVALASLIRPSIAVVVPGVVRTARELTAGNLFIAWGDSFSVLVGPLVAAMLLIIGDTWLVFAGAATLTLIAVVCTAPLLARERAVAVAAPRRRLNPVRELRAAFHELEYRPGSKAVLVALGAQYVLVGALDFLYVVMADQLLDLEPADASLLSVMFGVGAVIGGVSGTRVVARRRLAPMVVGGFVVFSIGLLTMAATSLLLVAGTMVVALGVGRTLLDLTGRMLLQRSAPVGALAALFAIVEVLTYLALAAGSVMSQVLVAVSGPRLALIGVAAVFLACFLSLRGPLAQVDDSADVPVVATRLLRSLPMFAPCTPLVLENVARAAVETTFAPGEVIIREGEIGETFYAIADGEVEVSRNGVVLATMTRGDAFGEVALLADVPRTATVRALTPTMVLAIDQGPFLLAVTGTEGARVAAWALIDDLDLGEHRDSLGDRPAPPEV
jgi:hypothetical protein